MNLYFVSATPPERLPGNALVAITSAMPMNQNLPVYRIRQGPYDFLEQDDLFAGGITDAQQVQIEQVADHFGVCRSSAASFIDGSETLDSVFTESDLASSDPDARGVVRRAALECAIADGFTGVWFPPGERDGYGYLARAGNLLVGLERVMKEPPADTSGGCWTVIGNREGTGWLEMVCRASKIEAEAECVRLQNNHPNWDYALVYIR